MAHPASIPSSLTHVFDLLDTHHHVMAIGLKHIPHLKEHHPISKGVIVNLAPQRYPQKIVPSLYQANSLHMVCYILVRMDSSYVPATIFKMSGWSRSLRTMSCREWENSHSPAEHCEYVQVYVPWDYELLLLFPLYRFGKENMHQINSRILCISGHVNLL